MKSRLFVECLRKINLEEEVDEFLVAKSEIKDLGASLAQIDALYRRVIKIDAVSFGFTGRTMAKHAEWARFVIYWTPSDYKGLKKARGDFVIGQKPFFRIA